MKDTNFGRSKMFGKLKGGTSELCNCGQLDNWLRTHVNGHIMRRREMLDSRFQVMN